MSSSKQFKNLVCCGGGVKGLGSSAALKAMNNLDKMKYIEKVCGTSVGSMVAMLVACKCSNAEIDKYMECFWKELTNLPEGMLQQGYNIYEKMGLHDNKNIYDIVEKLLTEKYSVKKMTLKQFYDLTKVEYTAVTTNLTTRKANFMNYKTEPDLEVAKAVQMSTAVPVFFIQVKWHGQVFCDGGAVENFALEYYDDKSGRFNDETLGFHFKGTCPEKYKVNNVLQLLEGIEDAEITNNELQSIQNYDERFIIEIDTGSIDALDFDISKKDKEMLYTNGYNAAINFFVKLDQLEEKRKQLEWIPWLKSFVTN